ncbi:hypothetical protein OUZ56_004534 [Daphnia magna]|uniref:Uncharacterized protein n=1 Tax=Daphnia magna TaxID=35525 RepID=A0ABQ9YQ27_9CRUS|nr:hypothetical protein OUZ56_004534 [Daphnia magna]
MIGERAREGATVKASHNVSSRTRFPSLLRTCQWNAIVIGHCLFRLTLLRLHHAIFAWLIPPYTERPPQNEANSCRH